jgi:uncharacterized protein (TIRG00374 family)
MTYIKDLKDSKWVWYGVTTLIFGVLIYFADVNKFIESLTSADPLYFLVALIFGLSFFVSNAIIWHSFLREIEISVSFWKSLKLFMAGNFMNSVTPLGNLGGEPFMAYIISRNTEANYQQSISSIVSADLVNTIPFITYSAGGILYLFLFGSIPNVIMRATYFTVALILVGGTIAYLLWFKEDLLENFILSLLERIENKLGERKYFRAAEEKIEETINVFQKYGDNPRHLAKTSIVGHVSVVTQIICLYFVLLSLGVEPEIVPITLTVILSGLAAFTPTPGGSGTIEAAFSGLLMLFLPIAFDMALAAAFLFRMTTYLPGIPLGYLALINLQKGMKERKK